MAGAGKKRQHKERKNGETSEADGTNDKSSNSPTSAQQTSPQRLSPPSGWDGNRDPSAPRSRTGSDASASGAPGPSTMALPEQRQSLFTTTNKNLDLGYVASALMSGYAAPTELPIRPKTNPTGREVSIKLNTFHVTQYPSKAVYQYDVVIGNGAEKRGLIKRVWNSKAVRETCGEGWIFDGNKIAWGHTQLEKELRITVDLDKEDGKKPRTDKKTGQEKPDLWRVYIKSAGTVRFDALRGYLERKSSFDDHCIEAISFLDHLMRETPSQKYTQIKRNFFARGQQRTLLGGGLEAFKGVYASIRTVNTGLNAMPTLSVNVDVANGTFWTESAVHITAQQIVGARDANQLSLQLGAGKGQPTGTFKLLSKLKRVQVIQKHRGTKEEQNSKPFVIDFFMNKNSRQHKFKMMDHNTNRETEITIYDYFIQKYNIRLQFPDLPLIQMTKKGIVMPMECCYITGNQRCIGKLNERQTSEMIKFAVTLPNERWGAIEHGLDMLKWGEDRYLANYGLKVNPAPAVVKARLLPNPKVHFAGAGPNADVDPRTSGRWDLKGKRFLEPHGKPLKSWGVCYMPGRGAATKDQVEAFLKVFIQVFEGHGGKVANRNPVIIQGTPDAGKAVESLWTQAGNQSQAKPQILFFIVADKSMENYNRIKKSADCRYGVVSQVLQSAHVQKCQAQYCSNVCMKINAKLGGITARAMGLRGQNSWFKVPTMVVGADVSHGSAGSEAASIASMTVSWDRNAIRYAAAVETNGQRVEMITKANIEDMFGPLVQRWMTNISGGQMPQHLIYVRDGVSEGQYAHVINQEVHDMRLCLKGISPKAVVKFTVVVASKRHHVRFFPDKASGDRNGNPQPGTLVESGVTHPFEYDFYLCAHSAIKGTARPVHYHVLMDEMKMSVEDLQNWLYEASYQYVRSTTPVSMFPAVYYAHLAAYRGIAHLQQPAESGPSERGGTTHPSSKEPTETKPLLKMKEDNGILDTMWYI